MVNDHIFPWFESPGLKQKFFYFSLHTLNISWTSLEYETLREFPNYVNENMLRLNIAGCRKTMSDDSK